MPPSPRPLAVLPVDDPSIAAAVARLGIADPGLALEAAAGRGEILAIPPLIAEIEGRERSWETIGHTLRDVRAIVQRRLVRGDDGGGPWTPLDDLLMAKWPAVTVAPEREGRLIAQLGWMTEEESRLLLGYRSAYLRRLAARHVQRLDPEVREQIFDDRTAAPALLHAAAGTDRRWLVAAALERLERYRAQTEPTEPRLFRGVLVAVWNAYAPLLTADLLATDDRRFGDIAALRRWLAERVDSPDPSTAEWAAGVIGADAASGAAAREWLVRTQGRGRVPLTAALVRHPEVPVEVARMALAAVGGRGAVARAAAGRSDLLADPGVRTLLAASGDSRILGRLLETAGGAVEASMLVERVAERAPGVIVMLMRRDRLPVGTRVAQATLARLLARAGRADREAVARWIGRQGEAVRLPAPPVRR